MRPTRPNGIRPGSEAAALRIPMRWSERFKKLASGKRDNPLQLPSGLGTPIALISTDIHGEVGRMLDALLAIPRFTRMVDLGDKLDRGPEPIAANMMLELSNPQFHRLIGNHDAMWIGAGLGIERLAIELVRWLMRYNEQDFIVEGLGIDLKPLEEYAEKNFADFRGHFKSKLSKQMEAAATYLKIKAEAAYRFPQHRDTVLNESELRTKKALFHEAAFEALTAGERDTFNRLIGKAELDERDAEFFYRLMGGSSKLTDEEQAVIDHFTDAFRSNHAYYQLIECMVGRGDVYTTLTSAGDGAPVDMLLTHAGIPITEEGKLAEYNGLRGREAFAQIENDIRVSMAAWRRYIESNDSDYLEMHAGAIDRVGELPWSPESPLYMRVMQTAARAVLEKESGLYAEPEKPFFTDWVGSRDPKFVHEVCRNIGPSFGLNARRLLIVHGHKPNKVDGMFQVTAGGHDLNIDAGTSINYGGRGGLLLVGTNALYQFSLVRPFTVESFSRVELNLEAYDN